ncbi:MAG: O-antigen ligase family protein [Bacteroidetes bacterium]|nr:O-antigen ligase family protein [Bacteroidota bacterium]
MQQKTVIHKVLPEGRDQWVVYLLCVSVFAGFSLSRAMISVGVIGLIAYGLLAFDIGQTLRTYLSSPAYYINVIFLLTILLSGINSDDKHLWATFVQIKLPFLFLPVAFCAFQFFDSSFFHKLLIAFSIIMVLSAVGVMVNYALHYDEITRSVSYGGIIPTPFSHIRYTLLLVFAFFCLIRLYEQRAISGYQVLPLAVFLFVVIHILSSRSGWIALYSGLLLYAVVYIIRTRRYAIGSAIALSTIVAPLALYFLIPSFQNKINYMRWTAGEVAAGHIDNMSDAMRIASWRSGMEIIKRHPLTGVGAGDLLVESKAISHELFPSIVNEDDRKMPHNEFIWIWAAAGILGLLAYLAAFIYPFVSSFRKGTWLMALLFLIFFSAFLTEAPLEEQIGSTFYLLFLLIFLTSIDHSPAIHD